MAAPKLPHGLPSLVGNLPDLAILERTKDGPARLRELVLSMALRGRLSRRDSADMPAAELLKQVATERANYALREKCKLPSAPKLATGGAPFELPATWAWASLGELSFVITDGTHHTPKYLPSGVPFISIKDISGGHLDFTKTRVISEGEHREINKRCNPQRDDLLICRIGTLGCPVLVDTDRPFSLFVSVGLIKFAKRHISPQYLLLALRSPVLTTQYEAIKAGGSHTNKLNLGDIPRLLVPIPPLSEQIRIVARVYQLLALCDELETKQTAKRETGDRLTMAALGALTSARSPEEFEVAWKRFSGHFSSLIDAPEHVELLRDAVINLGIRGHLSKAEKGDERIDALLGKLKLPPKSDRRTGRDSSSSDTQPLFSAPSHWAWRPLGELADVVGGVTKGRDLRGRRTAPFPYLRVANVQRGFLDLNVMKEIQVPVEELPKYQLYPGDILFTEGGDWDKLGRSAVWKGAISPCLHQNHIFRARLVIPGLEPQWCSMLANSPSGRRYFEEASKQTTNLASINMTQLRACPMPVPPREEQRRIIARVEQLLAICDELDAGLRSRGEKAAKLADAIVAYALAP